MPLGDDPLIPIDAWPGMIARYAFAAGDAGSATLTVNVAFDPASVVDGSVAQARYAAILDELTDPRVTLSVTTALADGPVALAAGEQDARAALAGLVAEILASPDPETVGPAPAAVTLTGTLPRTYAAQIATDLFPLWVSIETIRDGEPHHVPPVTSRLSPWLAPDADPATALADWAGDLEHAFADFDGSGGLLKVLSPTATAATAAPGAGAAAGELWALRWSPSAGIAVERANAGRTPPADEAPAYLTALPLSTELLAGTVEVVSYDDAGNPGDPVAATFREVDLDLWARSFLAAVDDLLTPALAELDPVRHTALTAAAEEIAAAIASGISWVYADQAPGAEGAPGAGDLEAARTVLRQSLLDALSTAFAASAVVQVPVAVSVHGPEGGGVPELMGTPTASGVPGQHGFTSATLPLADGTAWLTFLADVADPAQRSGLCLPLSYDVAFVEDPPPSRLRFVLPGSDPGTPGSSVLEVPLGTLDVPIALRAHPAPPRLVSQAVTADHETPPTLASSVAATYTLTVGTPAAAQDTLHLSLLLNGAVDETPCPAAGGAHPLFAPLAAFESFRAGGHLELARAAIVKKVPGAAERWLGALLTLVQDVAAAWPRDAEPPPRATEATPAACFALQVPDEGKPALVVTWTGDAAAPPADAGWPEIAGANPTTVDPLTRSYAFGALPEEVALRWRGLSVVTHQRISAAARIVRNETLGGACEGAPGKRTANPGLVYRTPAVTFEDPVMPLLEVTNTITVDSASLADALDQIVGGVMRPVDPPAQAGWSIEASYASTLAGGDQDSTPVETRLPILLASAAVTTAAEPPPGVDTTSTLSARLTGQIATWHEERSLAPGDARLVFSITLFADGGDQPILRVADVEAPVGPDGWWPSA